MLIDPANTALDADVFAFAEVNAIRTGSSRRALSGTHPNWRALASHVLTDDQQ
jgi:hypothetical protein